MVTHRRSRRNSAAKQTSNTKESAWGSYSIVNSHHKAVTGSRFEVLSGGINGGLPAPLPCFFVVFFLSVRAKLGISLSEFKEVT